MRHAFNTGSWLYRFADHRLPSRILLQARALLRSDSATSLLLRADRNAKALGAAGDGAVSYYCKLAGPPGNNGRQLDIEQSRPVFRARHCSSALAQWRLGRWRNLERAG